MQHHYSTSPSVTNRKNFPVKINKNLKALYEGSPFVVDHLAIVDEGVWDKDGRAIPGVNSPINHVLKKGTQIIMPDENQLSSQLSDLKAKIEKLLGMEEGHSARDRRRDRRDNVDDDLSNNIKKLHDAYDSAVEYDKKNDLRRDDIDQIEDALDVCRDAIKKDQRRRDAARRRDDDNSNDRRDGRDGDNEINKDRCDRRNRNDAAEDNSDIVKQLKENTEAVRMLCETLKQNSTVAEDKKKDGAMKVNGEAGNSEGEKKLEAQREGEGIAGESAKKDEGEDKDNLDKKIKDGIAESKLLSESKNDAMDKEKDKISSIFSKCDTAYQYLRLDRPQPFNFESASEFARRALKPLIAHSDEWSKIGMDKIVDNEILISKAITDSTQAIVDGVRKDAKKNNRLSEVVDGDASLTRKTTVRYEGDSKAFLDQFSTPTKVAKISYIPKIH